MFHDHGGISQGLKEWLILNEAAIKHPSITDKTRSQETLSLPIHLKLMKFVSENFLQGNSHRIGMPREYEVVLLASPSLISSIATRPSSEQVYMKPS
jgi:hypothetical protein